MNQDEINLKVKHLDFLIEREQRAEIKWKILGIITASIGGILILDIIRRLFI